MRYSSLFLPPPTPTLAPALFYDPSTRNALLMALYRLYLRWSALGALLMLGIATMCTPPQRSPLLLPPTPPSAPPCHTQSEDKPISASPPYTPLHRLLTYDKLTFCSLNIGGVEITPNRLCHLLSGFYPHPHTLSLQEYRPSSTSTARDHQHVAMFWGYHLLYSSPTTKDGVALRVHTSTSPQTPQLEVGVPGKLISTSLHSDVDPSMPEVTSYYGPHTPKERQALERLLDPLSRLCSIIVGDFNAVTHPSQTTALRANLWPRLAAKERSGALTDLLAPHCKDTSHTRVQRYAGSHSYIDRA